MLVDEVRLLAEPIALPRRQKKDTRKRCGSPPINKAMFVILESAHELGFGESTHDHAMEYAGSVNEKDVADPDPTTNRVRVTAADWRRFAGSVRDLGDPAIMARAWQ